MYRSLFPSNVFVELERLQRGLQGSRSYQECRSNSWYEMQQAFDVSPSIRGLASPFGDGGYPAMNVGTTAQSVEVFCFAPGIEPNSIDVNIERGVLTIAGERRSDVPTKDDKINLHIDERFAGKFRRVVTLPEDADPDAVQASYRDGVLQVSVQRRKAAQPKRITIQ